MLLKILKSKKKEKGSGRLAVDRPTNKDVPNADFWIDKAKNEQNFYKHK